MTWQPRDLASICPVNGNLTSCTCFGFIYLNLLTQLYGGNRIQRKRSYLQFNHSFDQDSCSQFERMSCLENHQNFNQGGRNQVDGGFNDNVVHGNNKQGDCNGRDGHKGCCNNIYEKIGDNEEYDFIIVGAGTAGCVLANRLTEINNWKVLLLEAGPEQPDVALIPGLSAALLGSSIDWQYTTEPDGVSCLARQDGRCSWPRGKVMGGSSTINSMLYVRGNKVDYDGWEAMGDVGWSYEDVLPYFKKSENNLNIDILDPKYHGANGYQSVSYYPHDDAGIKLTLDALHEIGLPPKDFNGPQQIGANIDQTTTANGERVSAYTGYIQPIRYKRKNLTVRPNSEVTKILFDENKRAYGVKYVNNDRNYTAKANKEVIVSAGSINTPKLLMLSGIGPNEHLKELNIDVISDLAVGKNLQDHVTFNAISIALSRETSNLVSNGEILKHICDFEFESIKESPLAYDGPIPIMAFIDIENNSSVPDIQYSFSPIFLNEFVNDPVEFDATRILPSAYYDGLIVRIALMQNENRGLIRLNLTDPAGPPLMYANYFDNDKDLATMLRGVRYLLKLEDTNTFKANNAYFVRKPLNACKDHSWGTDDYFICIAKSYTSSAYHPVGTCKMGPEDDETAVVDPRLRVYGVTGLRVVDASIMPRIIRANTNGPTLMIGEKGADMIKADHGVFSN